MQQPEPFVSVILPVYIAERFVLLALASLYAQTYARFEIIVIDGGATGNTAALMLSADQVDCLTQPGRGVTDAWNTVLKAAVGDYVCFIDSADPWPPDKLERQVRYLEKHPEAEYVDDGDDYWELEKLARQMAAAEPAADRDAIFGHVQQFISPELAPAERGKLRMPESLLPGVDVGTLLIRREAFERVGPYQDRWNVGEFIDWYGRAVDAGLGLSLLPERVGWRRVHLCNSSRIGAQRSGYARALKPLLDRHSLASGPQI